MSFRHWRRAHRMSSAIVSLVGLVHCAVTPMVYSRLSPDAVWFLGTGLGLLLLGVLNWAHVGVEPCDMPTAPLIRWANVLFLVFSFGAVAAVNEPQAWVGTRGSSRRGGVGPSTHRVRGFLPRLAFDVEALDAHGRAATSSGGQPGDRARPWMSDKEFESLVDRSLAPDAGMRRRSSGSPSR